MTRGPRADRPAATDDERAARRRLVACLHAVRAGTVRSVDAAPIVLRLRDEVGGVEPDDPDFAAFALIESETDDLPRAPDVARWDHAVLAARADDFARAEDWAGPIARAAWDALLRRFAPDARRSPSP
ncbi:MAG: hypothetical protein U1E39_08300 [Planctomycetota bacterium]